MPLNEWRVRLNDSGSWQHSFGSPESPVIVAAMDPRTVKVCETLRGILAGEHLSVIVLGSRGSGKSMFLAALLAGALERGIPVRALSASSDFEPVLRDLSSGKIGLLAVDRLDQLSVSVQSAVLAHRARCGVGLLATAEHLSAAKLSALVETPDVVARIPALEDRELDVLAISQLLWPQISGYPSDLLANCSDEAAENLFKGPYPNGVGSLRVSLTQLANSLIISGALQGGEFRRIVVPQDIGAAVLAAVRAELPAPQSTPVACVLVAEGSTDVAYLTAAATAAEQAWGWKLLDGCELRAAAEGRSGGASAVWPRLIELVARSIECVGLLDNDDVGRREYKRALEQSLQVELLPAELDRLRLPDNERVLEVEDLFSLRTLDRFYETHPDVEPEEIRWRGAGAWRIVPRGKDKDALAEWVARDLHVEDCERLVYLLCRLRKRLGLPIPRQDLDQWRQTLSRVDEGPLNAVMACLTGDRGGGG